MNSKTKRLSALADIYQTQKLDGSITQIRLGRIRPSQEQPRQDRTYAVEELAESIRHDGLLSPIVVAKEQNHYRIIAGERRYHAVQHLGWEQVECRIISREERDYWRIAIIENLQRENLSPQEEALALLRLKQQENLSDAALAQLVGKSRNYITEILGIAQLPQKVMEQCQSAGIDQRNMLIQVVQAHRRGIFLRFMEACQKGLIRTVRDARDFNQRGGEEQSGSLPQGGISQIRTAGSSSNSDSRGKRESQEGYLIACRQEQVVIECPGKKEALSLAKRLKTELQPNSDRPPA